MARLMARVHALWQRDEGQDLLEYALLVALIALLCIVAVTSAGNSIGVIFTRIGAALAAVAA